MTKKSTLSILLILMLLVTALTFTGCGAPAGGGSDSDDDSAEEVYEEEDEDEAPQSAVTARLELDDYAGHAAPGEDVTIRGEINHSYGQDVIVLKREKEVARITLEGRDGDPESFKIVVPGDVIQKDGTALQVMGCEIPGVVEETYTKTFTVSFPEE